MDALRDIISSGETIIPGVTMVQALLSLLMAFIIGQFTAWVYVYTHSGISYSRAFVQSIVLLTMVVCMAMLVIGNNVIVAFGLIGALAVIRFRNVLKDTRDTAFIFFSLIAGMATGTGRFKLAVLGTALFSAVLLYLHWTAFGSRHLSDGFIRFHMSGHEDGLDIIRSILRRYARSAQLVSQRFSDEGTGEIAYRLTMRDPGKADELVARLQDIQGISRVTFVLQEEHSEI